MDIDIELDTQVYQCLLTLALRKKISLNLLIEMHLKEKFLEKNSKHDEPQSLKLENFSIAKKA